MFINHKCNRKQIKEGLQVIVNTSSTWLPKLQNMLNCVATVHATVRLKCKDFFYDALINISYNLSDGIQMSALI